MKIQKKKVIKIYKITQNLFYFLNEEGKNMNNLYLIKIDIIKFNIYKFNEY